MAVTPQTNTTLEEIAQQLLTHDNYVICGHVSPDGDCLGSQLALAWALRQCGKQVAGVLARDEPIDGTLAFLPGAQDLVPAVSFDGPCESFIAVDVPTPERLGDAARLQAQAAFTVTVDHHAVPQAMSQLSYTDPDAASTTMLVWHLAALLGCDRDKLIATCAYTGLMTDTGRFQYQNADGAAFTAGAEMVAAGAEPSVISRNFYQNRSRASVALEAVAIDHMVFSPDGRAVLSWLSLDDFERCGAVKSDAEPLIDVLRSVAGVSVACMLREQPTEVRGSFRAKDDTDVAALAAQFGGGGHRAAAGFTIHEPLPQAVAAVTQLLGIPCPAVAKECL